MVDKQIAFAVCGDFLTGVNRLTFGRSTLNLTFAVITSPFGVNAGGKQGGA